MHLKCELFQLAATASRFELRWRPDKQQPTAQLPAASHPEAQPDLVTANNAELGKMASCTQNGFCKLSIGNRSLTFN